MEKQDGADISERLKQHPFLEARVRGLPDLVENVSNVRRADEPYAKVTEKLRHNYGITIPVSSAHEVTLHHALALQAKGILPAPAMTAPVSTLIAETDGSMIPCVNTDSDDPHVNRRKTRQLHWKEVKLSLVLRQGEASPLFGEIESGHRQVVQKRIKRPSARWKLENAGAMINLIAARAMVSFGTLLFTLHHQE